MIGIIIIWKMGLLSYILNLKKNGNGHNDAILKELVELKENHLHSLEIVMQDMKHETSELRKELNAHAQEELRIMDKIVVLLEKKI